MCGRFLRMMGLALVLVLGVACGIDPAMARKADMPWQSSFSSADFAAQLAELRRQPQPDGPYGGVSAANRAQVETQLAVLQALFERRGVVSRMTNPEQVQLANAQATINTLLTAAADDDQLVCTMEHTTRTHFRRKICQSKREWRELARGGREGYQNQFMKGGPRRTSTGPIGPCAPAAIRRTVGHANDGRWMLIACVRTRTGWLAGRAQARRTRSRPASTALPPSGLPARSPLRSMPTWRSQCPEPAA